MEKIAKNLQLILMVIILISTVIAVGIEISKMFENRSVKLAYFLLMFSLKNDDLNPHHKV